MWARGKRYRILAYSWSSKAVLLGFLSSVLNFWPVSNSLILLILLTCTCCLFYEYDGSLRVSCIIHELKFSFQDRNFTPWNHSLISWIVSSLREKIDFFFGKVCMVKNSRFWPMYHRPFRNVDVNIKLRHEFNTRVGQTTYETITWHQGEWHENWPR